MTSSFLDREVSKIGNKFMMLMVAFNYYGTMLWGFFEPPIAKYLVNLPTYLREVKISKNKLVTSFMDSPHD